MTLSDVRTESDEARIVRQVLQQLDYVPHTGKLVGRINRIPMTRVDRRGYGYIDMLGDRHRSAVLVWVWHHKALPPGPLRHANGDKADDMISNLWTRTFDGSVEGSGKRWIARGPNPSRRGDIIGVYRSFEKALAAREDWEKGANLV